MKGPEGGSKAFDGPWRDLNGKLQTHDNNWRVEGAPRRHYIINSIISGEILFLYIVLFYTLGL